MTEKDRPDLGDFAAMEPSRRRFLQLLSAAGFSAPLLVVLDASGARAASAGPVVPPTPTPTPPPPTPTPTPTPTPPPTPTPTPTPTPAPTPTPTPQPTPTPTPTPTVPSTSPIKGKKRLTGKQGRYTFSSPTPGATFQARIDKRPWKPCASPYIVKTKKLASGEHHLRVRAVLGGVVDPTPSVKTLWVIR